ncbi:MAG: hypothetical protein K6U74_08595, partial [Firmicutes bacterium]|nr:hypothetical protein [Bacillota bacterium]
SAAAKTATPGLLSGFVQKQAAVLSVGDVFVVATVLVLIALPFAGLMTRGRVEAEHRRQEALFRASGEGTVLPAERGVPG